MTATNRVRWRQRPCSTRNVMDVAYSSSSKGRLCSSPSLSVLRHFLCLIPRQVELVKFLQQAATPGVLESAMSALWIPFHGLTRCGVLFPRNVPNPFPTSVVKANLDRFLAGPLP
ncbi:hypothetical protein OS493_031358 [Desmophyllum pertusum]|uniref:Uncharacterized protein n=1 Tax=Desmophyllum pertusum TaxID=174260 RepID=A0A9X0CJY3_9CNID|nr:hypothetical protein OS493_031358 [Desmophyllum pertusum]